MNLTEGTRRLALLLGVAGAIYCGFRLYGILEPALEVQSQHDQFERWANSPVVQLEHKAIQATPPPKIDPKYPDLPPGIDPLKDSINRDGIKTIDWYYVDGNYYAGEIDTEDGYHLYKTLAPPLGVYLWCVLLPFLGFFIPWSAVHILGWVAGGFMKKPDHDRA